MIPHTYSHAHREAVRRLKAGYRLAFDAMAKRMLGLSGWWLTNGKGQVVYVAASLAERLIKLGFVRELQATPDVIYYEATEKARKVA